MIGASIQQWDVWPSPVDVTFRQLNILTCSCQRIFFHFAGSLYQATTDGKQNRQSVRLLFKGI